MSENELWPETIQQYWERREKLFSRHIDKRSRNYFKALWFEGAIAAYNCLRPIFAEGHEEFRNEYVNQAARAYGQATGRSKEMETLLREELENGQHD